MATVSRQGIWLGLAGLFVGFVVGLVIATTYSDQIEEIGSAGGNVVEQPENKGGGETLDY